MMTPQEYQAFVTARPLRSQHPLPPRFDLRDLYIVTAGLAGETGEVCECVELLHAKSGFSIAALQHELGDVFWYFTAICALVEVRLEELDIETAAARAIGIGSYRSATGLAKATGLICDTLKKFVRDGAFDTPLFRAILHDWLRAWLQLVDHFQSDYREIIEANVKKLRVRDAHRASRR